MAEAKSPYPWSDIRTEYIHGEISQDKLCAKYGCPKSTLRHMCKREGWVELRQKAKDTANEKLAAKVGAQKADRLARIMAASDKLLTKIDEIIDKTTAGDLVLDKSALRAITGALKDIKDIQEHKTLLDIEEQEARIAKLKKEISDNHTEPIHITIDNPVKEFCD